MSGYTCMRCWWMECEGAVVDLACRCCQRHDADDEDGDDQPE